MDPIIKSLNEIELQASDILEQARQEKEKLFASYEKESKEWDAALEKETEQKIQEMRERAEAKSAALLASDKARTDKQEEALRLSYERYHELYVDKLFDQLVQE